jgi:predicted CxxxxCH...CXXCH cytochrome family protein
MTRIRTQARPLTLFSYVALAALMAPAAGGCEDFSSGDDSGQPCVRADISCTDCHGDSDTGNPAPPLGTAGETAVTEPAVGAHQSHLSGSSWHRQVQCADCHVLPSVGMHSNSVVDFAWGGPSNADGANSSYDTSAITCSGTYCHGTTLDGPNAGGTVARTPEWTTVDGSFKECGTTCHTNPPGGTHPVDDQCESCHGAVIASYNAGDPANSVWADSSRHIDGAVQVTGYHDLLGWTAPKGGTDHHGSNYFMTNQQADEHNTDCTACHGANLDGGSSGISCDNLGCHTRDWRSCDFCHGTNPGQYNPPAGVGDETATDTLAVGQHAVHLSSSFTHVAFDCDNCHNIPAAGDVSHALGYVPSADLQTEGHHGDVALTGRAAGMTWDVTDTMGNPITARGSCVGACHSDGNGGPPNVTPYWAGGTWTAGGCGNCHDSAPSSGEHGEHVGEATCNQCHPNQSTTPHMNGSKDYTGNAILTPDGCGPGIPSCDGMCHGRDHQDDCW